MSLCKSTVKYIYIYVLTIYELHTYKMAGEIRDVFYPIRHNEYKTFQCSVFRLAQNCWKLRYAEQWKVKRALRKQR